jgi:hypothetical protein
MIMRRSFFFGNNNRIAVERDYTTEAITGFLDHALETLSTLKAATGPCAPIAVLGEEQSRS